MNQTSLEPDRQGVPQQIRQAQQALQQGDLATAGKMLKALKSQLPLHDQILRLWGMLNHRQGNLAEAASAFNLIVKLLPDSAQAHNDLANILLAAKEWDAAEQHLQQALELEPELPQAWFNQARLLKATGEPAAALEAILKVIKAEPEYYGARVIAGDLYKALGNMQAAEEQFRQGIQQQPGNPIAWWSLANSKTARFSEQETAQLQRLVTSRAGNSPQGEYWYFALAKALEDQRDYEQAFVNYRLGNQERQRKVPWNALKFSRWVDELLEASPQLQQPADRDEQARPRPIFIVSLPRSGSTLAEQILAAHPLVTGADELPYIPQLIAAESRRRRSGFTQWSGQLQADQWQRIGDEYLELSSRWWRDTPVFCDKLPGNFVHLGAILSALPSALIVVCRRQPLDVSLSCYRQLFVAGQEFSYDLKDLAAYYKDFDRLCRYWEQRCPQRVFSLQYEELVSDGEAEIPRLIEFAGLEMDPACLDFHRDDRAVATASAAQVRQPLNQRGVGYWQRYQTQLAPLLQAFSELGYEL